MLQSNLRDLEQHQQSYAAQVEHEVSMKQQTIETLERQNGQLKERLD